MTRLNSLTLGTLLIVFLTTQCSELPTETTEDANTVSSAEGMGSTSSTNISINTPPVIVTDSAIISTALSDVQIDREYSVHIEVTDPDIDDALTIEVHGDTIHNRFGIYIDGDSLKWMVNDGDYGEHTFTIIATDIFGASDSVRATAFVPYPLFGYEYGSSTLIAGFTHAVYIDKGPGPNTAATAYTIVEGTVGSMIVGDTLYCVLPPGDTTTQVFIIEAIDSKGRTETQHFTFLITLPRMPQLNVSTQWLQTGNNQVHDGDVDTIPVDALYTVNITGVQYPDRSADSITLALIDSPLNMTFYGSGQYDSTGVDIIHSWILYDTLSWTPKMEDVGMNTINLALTGVAGIADTVSWSALVVFENTPPQFTMNNQEINETLLTGDIFLCTLKATDLNYADTLFTYSVVDPIPSGMTITDTIVSWIPADSLAGTIDTVLIQVTDGHDAYDTVTYYFSLYAGWFDRVKTIDLQDTATMIETVGTHLVIASSGGGTGLLQVFSLSNPTTPILVGSLDFPYGISFMQKKDNYLYVIADSLLVVDLSNPAVPTIVGSNPQRIGISREYGDISGTHLYVLSSLLSDAERDTVIVYDISTPTSPTIVSGFSTVSTDAYGLAVVDNSVLIPSKTGIAVVDVSTPTTPGNPSMNNLGFNDTWGQFRIEVQGEYAYVYKSGFFHIVDISIPTSPNLVKTLNHLSDISNLVFLENTLYLTGGAFETNTIQAMDVLDVSNPIDPFYIGRVTVPAVSTEVMHTGVALTILGNYAYVLVSDQTLLIFTIR